MVEKKERNFYVKEIRISFDREEINKAYNLKEIKDGSKFKKLVKDINYQNKLSYSLMEKVSGTQ